MQDLAPRNLNLKPTPKRPGKRGGQGTRAHGLTHSPNGSLPSCCLIMLATQLLTHTGTHTLTEWVPPLMLLDVSLHIGVLWAP